MMIQNLYKLVDTPSHMEWNRIKQENAEYFLALKIHPPPHPSIPIISLGFHDWQKGVRSSFLCIFLLLNSLCSLSCVMLFSWLFCDNYLMLICYYATFLYCLGIKAYLLI